MNECVRGENNELMFIVFIWLGVKDKYYLIFLKKYALFLTPGEGSLAVSYGRVFNPTKPDG